MRDLTLESVSFLAIFCSLAVILVFLAVSWEAANREAVLGLGAVLVGECAMKGLLLTAILGLGGDWYLKKHHKT